MVIVSCTTKFHAFDLAEQMDANNMLTALYTSYHSQKNTLVNRLHHRKDYENITLKKIHTIFPIAAGIKKFPQYEYEFNNLFDKYVALRLSMRNDYKAFIGWSGMSLNTIKEIKKRNKLTIVERGSSHILYQDKINNEEYKLQTGKDIRISKQIIEKELKEYELADYISIPSNFVKKSFLEYGVAESKLFYNPYGVSNIFQQVNIKPETEKFKIVYLGHMGICKGLLYMFQAINNLKIPLDKYEVWFIGGMADEIKEMYNKYQQSNWRYFGYIEHLELPNYLKECDVAIQPSVQEGLSRVIPQMLGLGIPVIASQNTGGEDIIEEGKTGYIVPIRDSESIKNKIEALFNDNNLLNTLKLNAYEAAKHSLSWSCYGKNYSQFIKSVI